jgi:HlyD family secretion protein
MMKKSTYIIIGVTLAALLVFILIPKNNRAADLSYETTNVAISTISNSVTATGTVKPIKQVEVGTQVSGIIDKIYVDFNSEVKAGQLLAELDKSVLQMDLEASRANLNSAKIEYDYQTINYNRIKGLYEKGLVSDSEYESAEYQYAKANTSYLQAQANSKKAERNIGYATIYSPINGVVLSRAVDEGQTVASGFSTPTLFTIANDLTKMQVVANVDEADIGEVKEGQKVEFTVDAFPGITFEGTVLQVRLQASTTSNVVTYEVIIDAPNPELKLMPGLTANVIIQTLEKTNIVTVPVRALRFTPEGYEGTIPKNCVWRLDEEDNVEPIEVVTGSSDGINTEIISGVKAGDEIITGIQTAPVARASGRISVTMGPEGNRSNDSNEE